jgi:hypothetical protein
MTGFLSLPSVLKPLLAILPPAPIPHNTSPLKKSSIQLLSDPLSCLVGLADDFQFDFPQVGIVS